MVAIVITLTDLTLVEHVCAFLKSRRLKAAG